MGNETTHSSTTRLRGETKGSDTRGQPKHFLRFWHFCRMENDEKKEMVERGRKAARKHVDTSSKEACTVAVRFLHANLWQCGWLVRQLCGNSLAAASLASVSCAVGTFFHPQTSWLAKKKKYKQKLTYSLWISHLNTFSKTNTKNMNTGHVLAPNDIGVVPLMRFSLFGHGLEWWVCSLKMAVTSLPMDLIGTDISVVVSVRKCPGN